MNWLDLCRGRACIACRRDDGTIVPAHRNEGKGMGMKTSDWTVIPLCGMCHNWYDNGMESREDKRVFWKRFWVAHMLVLCEAGLVTPLGHKERERRPVRLAKSLPRVKPDWNGPSAA